MYSETTLMIRSIQSIVNNESYLSENLEQIDWQRFSRMTAFHSIRPVLFQYLQDKIKNDRLEQLRIFATNQTFINLQYGAEIRRLLGIFAAKGIPTLPYKGVLFVHELYKNTQLREVGDMDFLFLPSEAKKAMFVFFDEGYELSILNKDFDKLSMEEKINAILGAKNQYEVSFKKDNLSIDFHWGMHHGFLPYKINMEDIFKNAENRNFFGVECLMPSAEDIFFMLLLHHGGKENWTRMKHFADLAAFLNSHGSLVNWSKIIKKATDYKLKRQLLMGFYLLRKYFEMTIPSEVATELKNFDARSEKQTVAFWNDAQHWSSLFSRLRFENILRQNQDAGFSFKKYLTDFFHSYSKPNIIEDNRIWIFQDKFPILNFISKAMTYLIRKYYKI